MNDKELDDFFRNKSENPEIPFREEDWEKLKTKLDSPPPSSGKNGSGHTSKGWWIGLFVFVLISGAGLGWKYWGEERVVQDITLKNNPIKPHNIGDRMDKINHTTSVDSFITKAVAPTPDSMPKKATVSTRRRENQHIKEASMNPMVDAAHHPNSGNNNSERMERFRIVPIEPNQQNQQILSMDMMSKEQAPGILKSIHKGKNREVPISEPKASKDKIKGSRFFTTLTLAPDVSALKIEDIQGLGNSVGLNLEYFFHSKISMNAGALYVFKTYQAGAGYSTGYVPAPSHIIGDCWVLDLPLNIRYYAFNQRLSRWYMTAGLSSYLMLKEKYQLDYKSYNYGGKTYNDLLEVKNKNKHYLNIVNLGIGYERVLGNKVSLQVEPYLKLPLNGIGEGNIILKSAGAFVGLKYGW